MTFHCKFRLINNTMKKKTFLISSILFSINLINAENIKCNCGSHDTGITTYWVETANDDQGCCSGAVMNIEGSARFVTYVLREGVYYAATHTTLDPPQAQRDC